MMRSIQMFSPCRTVRLTSWLGGLVLAGVVGQHLPAAEPRPSAVTPLAAAHAHNDYEHARPLQDALAHGFTSVEADIHLVDGRLLVAHDADQVRPERTLEALYLDPLRERVRAGGGRVYTDGPGFTLLIDIKTEAEPTYRALAEVLAQYGDMLSVVREGTYEPGAVTIVVSGNRPRELMKAESVRYAGFDGRVADLDSDAPAHFMPMISDRWGSLFRWQGDGPVPPVEREKLQEIVRKAHAAGRKVRFWAAPDREEMWRELTAAGADLINTDDLAGLEAFLRRSASSAAGQRPNFVIIIADDVSHDDIGCYGHPRIRTPHVDALARSGVRFDQAFLTTSSCSPSRASIMTGRYPHDTGAAELHMPLPADQVVFPGLLRAAGYFTASAGKWHLGDAARVHFDKIVGGAPSGCEHWVDVLRDRPTDRPFFLWLASLDAHRDYQSGAIPTPHTTDDVVVPPYLPDTPETRGDLAMYYDEIARLDGYVGEVVAELERQGVAENTFVLFMADNGRPFPRSKTTLYDSGVQTPFIVRWPRRVGAGAVSRSLVSAVDIAPTLLELAGLDAAPSFQGKSFARLLDAPEAQVREYVFAEHNWHDYQAHERAVRSREYLYIRNSFPHLSGSPPADAVRSPTYQAMIRLEAERKLAPEQRTCFQVPRPSEELYRVADDPHQLRNLASDAGHAETLETMRCTLDAWIDRTEDRLPEEPRPDRYDRLTGRLPEGP